MATWSKSDRFASRRPATSDEPGPGSYDAKDVAKSTAGAVIRAARAEVRQRRGKSGKSCRRVLMTMCAVCVCVHPHVTAKPYRCAGQALTLLASRDGVSYVVHQCLHDGVAGIRGRLPALDPR